MRRALVLAASLLALITCVAPSAHAAPAATRAPDPVLTVISTAFAKRQITVAQTREYRRTWAASLVGARRARTWSRRNEILEARTYTVHLAQRRLLTPARLGPAMLSVKATTYVMRSSMRFPRHEAEVTIPGEPVVFTYYSGRGVQFQPFESFKYGMSLLNRIDPDVVQARKVADRMRELSVWHGSALVWEYYFPFNGPSTPWTSAISQSLGTEFFHRLSKLLPEAEQQPYSDTAIAMTRSFLRSYRAGGVYAPQGAGRWYLLYPFAPGQRILNGHLQVLINLSRYAADTNSNAARVVVDRGITAVLPLLPKFDTGAWSNYLPEQEANLNYHDFQTGQLIKLGKELENETFATYGERFTTYRNTPAISTIPATKLFSIIPAPDGFRDVVAVRYRSNKSSTDTLRIFDTEGTLIRTVNGAGGRGARQIDWNGRLGANNAVAPDGNYRATITSVDLAGNVGSYDVPVPLIVARDEVPPVYSKLVMSERAGVTTIIIRAADAGSAYVEASLRIGRATYAKRKGPRVGQITLRVAKPMSLVRKGTIRLRDSSNNVTVVPLSTNKP